MRTSVPTQAPAPTPTTQPSVPRRTRAAMSLVLAAVAVALALVASAAVVWQRGEIAERDDAIAAITAERDLALDDAAALEDRIAALRERAASSTDDVSALRRRLRDTRATLAALLGPALPDGRTFGRIVALEVAQDPPRLVFDIQQWFTDEAAVAAAIEDGVLSPDATIENGYYIRNADPRWRILPIDPSTPISLVTYPLADIDDPREVSISRFQQLFEERPGASLPAFPYWITVEDGTIVAIDRQFIP